VTPSPEEGTGDARETPARARPRLVRAGLAIGLAFTLSAVERLHVATFGVNAIQAALAEWGSHAIGVEWTEEPSRAGGRVVLLRALRGAAAGCFAAGFVACFGVATRAVVGIAPSDPASALATTLDVVGALAVAVRDELLLHGVTLRVASGARTPLAIAACGAASAAWALGRAGDAGAPLATLAVEGLLGASLGALWRFDKGAWMPVAAHAAWLLVARSAHLVTAPTAWGGGEMGLFAGWSSAAAMVLVCAIAATIAARRDEAPAPS
jgi:hypothetical protein